MDSQVEVRPNVKDLEVRDKAEAEKILAQGVPLSATTVRQVATKFGMRVPELLFDEWLDRERAAAVREHRAAQRGGDQ